MFFVSLFRGKCEDAPRQSATLTTNVRLDFEKCQQSQGLPGSGSRSSVVAFGRPGPLGVWKMSLQQTEAERKKQTAKRLKAASRKQSVVNKQEEAEDSRGEAQSKNQKAASRP